VCSFRVTCALLSNISKKVTTHALNSYERFAAALLASPKQLTQEGLDAVLELSCTTARMALLEKSARAAVAAEADQAQTEAADSGEESQVPRQ
jgi:hypothetical protein